VHSRGDNKKEEDESSSKVKTKRVMKFMFGSFREDFEKRKEKMEWRK